MGNKLRLLFDLESCAFTPYIHPPNLVNFTDVYPCNYDKIHK